jgi:hypothetical protein
VADVGFGEDEAVLDFDGLADVALVADAGVAADVTIRADLAVRADDHISLDEDPGQDAGAGAEMDHSLDHRGGMESPLDPVFRKRGEYCSLARRKSHG